MHELRDLIIKQLDAVEAHICTINEARTIIRSVDAIEIDALYEGKSRLRSVEHIYNRLDTTVRNAVYSLDNKQLTTRHKLVMQQLNMAIGEFTDTLDKVTLIISNT